MGALRFKDGVRFDRMSVGGACIIAALVRVAIRSTRDVVITAGTNGEHQAGSAHYEGEAYDVRTNDRPRPEDQALLTLLLSFLAEFTFDAHGDPRLVETGGGFATELFFAFIESPNTPNEHIHVQVRRGHTFVPPTPRELMT